MSVSMRNRLLSFLKKMEEVLPPPSRAHHALVFAQYGSDSAGWSDQLALQINDGGRFYAYFIEEGDFEMELDDLASEIVRQHAARKSSAQGGVALGQFIGTGE